MKTRVIFIFIIGLVYACNSSSTTLSLEDIRGTWKLISSTTIKPDTTIEDSLEGKEMIKMINRTHFSFLSHDLQKGLDSTTAWYVSGGGRYTLDGNRYQEKLEYCNYRSWEGQIFDFSVYIEGDTLVQKGVERVEKLGIEHFLVEKYVRVD